MSAVDLLGILHPDGHRDLRAIRNGQVVTASVGADDATAVSRFAAAHQDSNVYFGVATRSPFGRSTEDCLALHSLFVDHDFKDVPEAEARERLRSFPFVPSATVTSGGGWHSYWFLREPIDLTNGGAAEAKVALRRLVTFLQGDLSAAEPARVLRLPGTLNHKYAPPRPVVLEHVDPDRRYALDEILAVLPQHVAPVPAEARPALPEVIASGGRNDALFSEGCSLRRRGWSQDEIQKTLLVLNERCEPRLTVSEVESIAASCARYAPAADTFPLTEAGDAEFFATCFGDVARYDHLQGRWLLFDGYRWAPQTNGEINRLALDAIRARQRAAVGDQVRMQWAIRGEARHRQTNLLAMAQSVRSLADSGKDWDPDPWLLGVPNGVLDLRRGEVRMGRPEDRVTMQTRAPFDPNAQCPLWDKTVSEIFGGDGELIRYFDRLVGYSITADCREEMFPLCWGGGANGKGTVMNTIAWILGDYAADLPFSALELHERTGIPNDIAKIVGKRFVTASESGETKRLNEARVKALTGRDPVTARFLQKEFFTFEPVAKFWLATNHRPMVRDTSAGFWRRIHLVPFEQSFVGREDQTLKDRLRLEAPGILARAVRGCLDWQREGLNAPDVVRAATDSYRSESAPLARFLDARCVVQEGARATFGDLFGAYQRWCGEAREGGRLNRREFTEALRERFKTDPAAKRSATYLGVGLADLFGRDGDL